jgi:hypothetical protein
MSAMGQAVTVAGVATRPWFEWAADDPSEYYMIARDLGLNDEHELYLYEEARELGPPSADLPQASQAQSCSSTRASTARCPIGACITIPMVSHHRGGVAN